MLAGLVPLNPEAGLGGLRTVPPPVPRFTRGARAPSPLSLARKGETTGVSGMFGVGMECFAIQRKGD
jgi:hypothetical protein